MHFLPFVLLSLIQLGSGWAPEPPNPDSQEFGLATRVVGGVNAGVYLAYALAVEIRLKQHSRQTPLFFSALPNRVTLAWLGWLTAAISCVFLVLFSASLLSVPQMLLVYLPVQVAIILVLSFLDCAKARFLIRPNSNQRLPLCKSRTRPQRVIPSNPKQAIGGRGLAKNMPIGL